MKDFKIDPLTCPACAAQLDGALNTESDRGPEDGDPTLCADCGAILVFCGGPNHSSKCGPVNSLRYPTNEEQEQFLANPQMQKCIAAARLMRERGY